MSKPASTHILVSQNSERVTRSVIDLSAIDQRSQFEYFADEICRTYSNCFCERENIHDDFSARIGVLQSQNNLASLIDAPVVNIIRKQASQSEQLDLHFSYMLQGNVNFQYGEDKRVVGPGDFFVAGNGKQLNFDVLRNTERYKTLTVALCAEQYTSPRSRKELSNERRFTHHRLAPLLRLSMQQLLNSLQTNNDEEFIKLSTMVENLIHMIVHDGEDFNRTRPTDQQIFLLIESEVDRSLTNPDLDLELIANRLQLPKHRIQRIMAGRETSVTDFIRDKRLNLGLRQLKCETFNDKSIAEIAHNCGYSEQSSFSRAFKQKFGYTPGQVRQKMLET